MMRCVLVMAMGLAVVGLASAKVIYVDDDAPLGGGGASWATAYRHLQDALLLVEPFDQIRLGGGVYQPDDSEAVISGVAANDPASVFRLPVQGVSLVGGFAGHGAADPGHWDPEAYPTVLSGDLAGDDGPAWSGRADNALVLIVYAGPAFTQATSGLDAISRAPWFEGLTFVGAEHGAVHLDFPRDARFTRCVFRDNRSADPFGRWYGGAISAVGKFIEPTFMPTTDLVLRDCRFLRNQSYEKGGAIYGRNVGLRASGCSFIENWATPEPKALGLGGAIALETDDLVANEFQFFPITLLGCRFERNVASLQGTISFGGAIRVDWGLSDGGVYGWQEGVIADSAFIGNIASSAALSIIGPAVPDDAFGIRISNTDFTQQSDGRRADDVVGPTPLSRVMTIATPALIEDSRIADCWSNAYVAALDPRTTLSRVVISDNHSRNPSWGLLGFATGEGSPVFDQVVVSHGGPLINWWLVPPDRAPLDLQVSESTLRSTGLAADERMLAGVRVVAQNTIFSRDTDGPILYADDPDTEADESTWFDLDSCLIDANHGADEPVTTYGNGNLRGPAQFADAGLGLAADSPAVDAGQPAYDGAVADLAGRLRVFDGDGDGAAHIDMGAYELGAPRFGDLNCDGLVDYFDIDPFVTALLDPAGYAAARPTCDRRLADVSLDGQVDFFDIDPFVGLLTGDAP